MKDTLIRRFICLVSFPRLGLEKGDYFPAYRFTEVALDNLLAQKKIELIYEKL